MSATHNKPQFSKKFCVFPESIDIDRKGSIYISDASEGTLYRFSRTSKQTLNLDAGENLISKLKSGHGISIDQEKNFIYFGIEVKGKTGIIPKIVGCSLDIFDQDEFKARLPFDFEELKAVADQPGSMWFERNIPKKPNGIVFHKDTSAVFYTYERLIGGFLPLLNLPGYVGKVSIDDQHADIILTPMITPNGVDIDRSTSDINLIVAATKEGGIRKVSISPMAEISHLEPLGKGGHRLFGNLPDGLICLENGDVLVACFGSGKIIQLARADSENWLPPVTIVEGLGRPTDLVIGPSSGSSGRSIFVTTMKPFFCGRVVEIPDAVG